MPAVWQRATASATSGRGGSRSVTRPTQAEVALGVVARSAGTARPRRGHGDRRRPARGAPRAPRPRRARGRVARRPRRAGSPPRRRPASCCSGRAARRARPSRAPPSRRCRVDRRHELQGRDRSGTGARAPPPRVARPSRLRAARPPRAGPARSGRRCRPRRCPPAPSSALVHAASAAASRRSAAGGCATACGAASQATAPAGVQTRGRPHAVLGERPGLVGADHRRRAERLDRAQALHERAALGEAPRADGERQGDRGQQPLGDVGDEQADRERHRVARAAARRSAFRAARRPPRRRPPRGRSGSRPAGPRSGAGCRRHARAPKAATRPSWVVHAGGEHERAGVARRCTTSR